MTKQLVLGLDGGGTKTVCVALTPAGMIIGEGRSGSSNRNSVGDGAARANLATAIRSALQVANGQPQDVAALCAGLAGVDRPPERALVTEWLRELLPGVCPIIENDALIALASGTHGDLFGIVVISGTGMIVYGVDRYGQRQRAGGWGALLDAQGSGYAMGMAALQAIAQATDGMGPPTLLQTTILRQLGVEQPQALIAWTYRELAWARFAELAPLVIQCAEAHDSVADQIVTQTVNVLANAVSAVMRKLHLEAVTFPLVLAGGNFQSTLLRGRLTQRIEQLAAQAQVIHPAVEPAVGAAWLALKQVDGKGTAA
jgi:N-acetylglucosamine kinase-like BadF-type ATPase